MCAKPAWLILFVLFCIVQSVHGQNALPDSAFKNEAVDAYNAVMANQLEFYNGAEYTLYPVAYKGSAYFEGKNHCTPSLIRYNGTWYKDVPVLYDLYNDVMVAAMHDSLYVLRADKLTDIYLLNHHFINLTQVSGGKLGPGYYDRLYNSKSQVLVKRVRTVQNNVTQQGVEVTYENKDVIYIKKGNKYYEVSSKGSVLDVFRDKKKQLKQYLNDNKIRYPSDKEGSIVMLTRYYDQLTN